MKDEKGYKFHANRDRVDISEGTWLLCDKDPHLKSYEDRMGTIKQNFTGKEWDLFYILQDIAWDHLYRNAPYYAGRNIIHIYMLVIEALNRDLPLPPKLFQAVDERYQKENGKSIVLDDKCYKKLQIEANTNTREETNDLKALALMSVLVALMSNDCVYAEKVNAKKVMEKICNLAKCLDIPYDGLKSLNRDISKGLDIYIGDIKLSEIQEKLDKLKKDSKINI